MIIDHRDRLLLVTLESARLRANVHPLAALHSRLDSWRGIGSVEQGMERQGYELQLTRYDERGWRATFYVTGIEHSLTSDTASSGNRRRGVQVAAREALRKVERDG